MAQLTVNAGPLIKDSHPAWSPSGALIVFDTDRSGNSDLGVVKPDGTGLQQLTTNTAADPYPSWRWTGAAMSMLGHLRQISPALLERIKAKPALVDEVILYRPEGPSPESGDEDLIARLPANVREGVRRMPPEVRADFLAHVNAATRPKATKRAPATAVIDPTDIGAELDLGQAWHGVHFLLCGSIDVAAGPLGRAVLGGKEIGPDNGYGPARYLEPSEVRAVTGGLSQLAAETLAARFDPAALDRQAFYGAAAERGYGVLLYIIQAEALPRQTSKQSPSMTKEMGPEKADWAAARASVRS